jgi:intracellular septation protein
LAALNEVVWRTQSTEVWVNFKVFGLMGLTIVFVLTQLPLLKRYAIEDNLHRD